MTNEEAIKKIKDHTGIHQRKNERMKCKYCDGKGLVQIAPNIRGLKKCPYCGGVGSIIKNLKGRHKISVKVIKEFACANEHCKTNEKYVAYEEGDKYIVKVHNFDIVVPKKIFTEFFEITNIDDIISEKGE